MLCHDFAYTKMRDGQNPISRELGRVRAGIMHRALRIGGGSAYECENSGDYAGAECFMRFEWRH